MSSCRAARKGRAIRPVPFDDYLKVLPAISWGLMYRLPARTVLIVHPDTGTINHYKDQLRAMGHNVFDATSVPDGLRAATALPTPDVVMMAAEYLPSLDMIRQVLGSTRVPIVLLASAAEKEAAEKEIGVTAAGVLVDRADVASLKAVWSALPAAPEKKLVADLIPGISERAAQSLSEVVLDASPLPMETAVTALRLALAYKDDAVRVPALRALGNIASEEASLDVLAVAADATASKPVRLAALDALAKTLEVDRQVPPDVFAGLVPVSSDADAQISLAAARAIAVAKFDPAQFADLMVLKRVQEIKAGVNP